MATPETEQPTPIILLVEDNEPDVRLTMEGFKANGWRPSVHVVESVDRAITFLNRREPYQDAPRPDLLLLDLNLLGAHGSEVLRKVKSDPQLRPIPVVVLSSSVNQNDIRQAYSLHANSYVTKPLHFSEFARALDVVMEYWFGQVRLHSPTSV